MSKHCAIPACEWEDDTSNKGDAELVPACKGDHFIHVGCLKRLFVASRNPCCPLCRDGFLGILADLARDNPHVPTADPHTEIGSIDLDAVLWDPPGDDHDSLTGNIFGDALLFNLMTSVVHRSVQAPAPAPPPTGTTLPPSPFFRATGPPRPLHASVPVNSSVGPTPRRHGSTTRQTTIPRRSTRQRR